VTRQVPNPGKRVLRWIVGGILLVCIPLLCISFFLKTGISVKRLTLGNALISNSQLIWREKLELNIEQITLQVSQKSETAQPPLIMPWRKIGRYSPLLKLFSSITINTLSAGKLTSTLHLTEQKSGGYQLAVIGDAVTGEIELQHTENGFTLDVRKGIFEPYFSSLTGRLILNGASEKAKGQLTTLVADSVPVKVSFQVDENSLSFEGSESEKITTITPLVDLFGLSGNVQRWITEHLEGSRYRLESLSGKVPFANPAALLTTLKASIRVDDCQYTFAEGFAPVKTNFTDVRFENGALVIKPREATFYGQDGGESWLDIDLNDPGNMLLTVYIQTNAQINQDILDLLGYYQINIPFRQTKGVTEIDLRLPINLNTRQVTAEGTFSVDHGSISYDGKEYDITESRIGLKNSDINIDHGSISYGDAFAADVNGEIYLAAGRGNLSISVKQAQFELQGNSVTLKDNAGPLNLLYHFADGAHILDGKESFWQHGQKEHGIDFSVGAFHIPFSPGELSAELSQIPFDIGDGIKTAVSGHVSLENKKANLSIDFTKYTVKDLHLVTPRVTVDLVYDSDLLLKTDEIAEFTLGKLPLKIYPSEYSHGNNITKINRSRISYGDFIDSKVSGHYDTHKNEGEFLLQEIVVNDNQLKNELELDKEIQLLVSEENDSFSLQFPEYDLHISNRKQKGWVARFGDLSRLYHRSKLLQRFVIKEGSLEISSANGKKPYSFSTEFVLPDPLFIENDRPFEKVTLSGELADNGLTGVINSRTTLHFDGTNISINSKEEGFNLPAIIKYLERISPSKRDTHENTKKGINAITFNLENGYLYLNPHSKILSDQLNFLFQNGRLEMDLRYGEGYLKFELEDDHFALEGLKLSDRFMAGLIEGSSFTGGDLKITANGNFEDFSAITQISNTSVTGLTGMNNVMAFLNTVPALLTFSLPEYSLTGFPIDNAVLGVHVVDQRATIESLKINSPQFDATGEGWADFAQKSIDLNLYMTTEARQNIKKIPVFGYVLGGNKDKNSVTLTVSGDLANPGVKTSLLKEIAATPVEMLYRTLKLPFHMVEESLK
jgi:hypothetical protein